MTPKEIARIAMERFIATQRLDMIEHDLREVVGTDRSFIDAGQLLDIIERPRLTDGPKGLLALSLFLRLGDDADLLPYPEFAFKISLPRFRSIDNQFTHSKLLGAGYIWLMVNLFCSIASANEGKVVISECETSYDLVTMRIHPQAIIDQMAKFNHRVSEYCCVSFDGSKRTVTLSLTVAPVI